MFNRRCISTLLVPFLVAALVATPAAHGQTTWYVDDDAPADPGPGDPTVSDPNEDGSATHPFDAIQEGIEASDPNDGDTVLVLDGTYTGLGNKDLDFSSGLSFPWQTRTITVCSQNGPENCTIDCEGDGRGFIFENGETPEAVVAGFTIGNGSADWGGAIYCVDECAPTITDCIITQNSADHGGGGVYYIIGWSGSRGPTITNCTFSYNSAHGGGAIGCAATGSFPALTISNCLIFGNTATLRGGAISTGFYGLLAVNCTITGNVALVRGGAFACDMDSETYVANCIVWGNSAPEGPEFWDSHEFTVLEVSYSDVQGGWSGTGNIDSDPGFFNPPAGDYHLGSGSPCIDAADNDAVPADELDLDGDGDPNEPLPYDLDGNPRFVDDPNMPDTGYGTAPVVDMGAYEVQVPVWFVDDDAAPDGDGASWARPFRYLQDALAVVVAGDEIRVAGGTYVPSQLTDPNDPRSATFQLITGVGLYGGYAGLADPNNPNARDIELHESTLSGDLASDDDPEDFPGGPSFSDNSYHVVTGSGTDATAILDGFTVTAGNNDGLDEPYPNTYCGGGMYNNLGSPTVANCMFRNNSVHPGDGRGGGMSNLESSPTLTNCTFAGNWAYFSGGVYNYNSSPTLTSCTFSGNSGVGICNDFGDPTLINCAINENTKGGMYNYDSSPTVTNCSFTGNGGSGMSNLNGGPTVTYCAFRDNSAGQGAGMHSWGPESTPTVSNCTFSGNVADGREGGGAMLNYFEASVTVTNCVFTGNIGWEAGGAICTGMGSSTRVINSTFAGNSAPYGHGQALACHNWDKARQENSLEIANCILWDGGDEVWDAGGTTITITFSDIQDGWVGEGNIDADPLFDDPNGPDGIPGTEDDDLRLSPGSPCIDAGNNEVVPFHNCCETGHGAGCSDPEIEAEVCAYVPYCCTDEWDELCAGLAESLGWCAGACDGRTDIDGKPRCVDDPDTPDTGYGTAPIVDMGAYEYQVWYVDDDAPADPGPGDPTVSDPNEDGSPEHPFDAIQEGIDAAADTDTVLVLDGTYTGIGNRDLWYGGKAITVRSENGPGTCIIDCEGVGPGVAFVGDETAASILDGFTITHASGNPGAVWCALASPTIANCIITDNTASGVYIEGDSPTITGCTITGNTWAFAGGIVCLYGEDVAIANCTIVGNNTFDFAGGLFAYSSHLAITNCLIAANAGGGVQFSDSHLVVINCTITGNAGSGVHCFMDFPGYASLIVKNCILWADTGDEIYVSDILPPPVSVIVSDVEGGWPGAGNIDADPLFVDPDGPDDDPNTWEDNDYHLSCGSPCLDRGHNAFVPPEVTTDLDGNPRIVDGDGDGDAVVDMGAYEIPPCPDQLHIIGPIPNQVVVGNPGTIDATVQAGFAGLPGWEVVFTKLAGSFTFTAGTISPDGTQATVVTDQDGTAQMTFVADGAGSGLIGVAVTGSELPTAYSVFEIIQAARFQHDGGGEQTGLKQHDAAPKP